MLHRNVSPLPMILMFFALPVLFSPSLAKASDPCVQGEFSNFSREKTLHLASSRRQIPTRRPQTTEQKLTALSAKVSKLEKKVTGLQAQVASQNHYIAKLKQVMTLHSTGTVTVRARKNLELRATGKVTTEASKIDMKAPVTGAHGLFKADTIYATTVKAKSYTPGAGNIW